MMDRSRRVLILGSGSAALTAALRAADLGVRVEVTSELPIQNSLDLLVGCAKLVDSPPLSSDPFNGGCRSKGEKKRAARERRIRGGF